MSFIAAVVADRNGGAVVIMAALMTLGNVVNEYIHRFSSCFDDIRILHKDRLHHTLGSYASVFDIAYDVFDVLFHQLDLTHGHILLLGRDLCVWTVPDHRYSTCHGQ